MDKGKPRHRNGRPHRVFHAKEPTFGVGGHPEWREGYRLALNLTRDQFGTESDADRAQIFGETASSVFNLAGAG